MRANRINLVEAIYKARHDISDYAVRTIVGIVEAGWIPEDVIAFASMPSEKTLSVWKASLRKKGVQIPDKRRRKEKGQE